MTFFERAGREASRATAFSGNNLERDSENRSDDATESALSDPSSRIYLVRSGRLFLKVGDEEPVARFTREETMELAGREKDAVFLGNGADGPMIAMPSSADLETLPEHIKAIDYRSVYIQGLLDHRQLGELAQGAALLAWHATHRFCGRCGGPTTIRAGGYKRHCSKCDRELFPRTDPVTIMLAIRGNKCVLGRSPHFPEGMYSCLAGFVEPGETIEDAVRRETLEESGLSVGQVIYHASQPWPFPHSLMIGCYGEALGDKIDPDLEELDDCRWFTREEVLAMIKGEHPEGLSMPPPGAIAHVIIHDWAHENF